MGVAEAAVAAACETRALTHLDEIGQERGLILRVDLRTRRHRNPLVRARSPSAILAHAGAAVLGLEMLLVAVVDQGVETGDALSPDVPTLAAVATVGPAELNEFFAPKGDRARATVTGADVDLGLVQKLHGSAAAGRSAGADPAQPGTPAPPLRQASRGGGDHQQSALAL